MSAMSILASLIEQEINEGEMTSNTAITLPQGKMPKPDASPTDVAALAILQDNFSTDAEREEFSRAIKMHGITFLYLSNSPLPHPSARDLSVMGRLARSLSNFWPQSLVVGGSHDQT